MLGYTALSSQLAMLLPSLSYIYRWSLVSDRNTSTGHYTFEIFVLVIVAGNIASIVYIMSSTAAFVLGSS